MNQFDRELIEALEENGMRGASEEEKLMRIRQMSPSENIGLWLVWNGIIGYTSQIIRCVEYFRQLEKERR